MVANNSSLSSPAPAVHVLTDLEVHSIEVFVAAAAALRVPQSVGEIYGLLFVTPHPVSFDHILRKLRMSQGSASQGLKFLRGLGAVKRSYVPSNRRNHYTAETELRTLAAGILHDRIRAGSQTKHRSISDLLELMDDIPETDRPQLERRLKLLADWTIQAQTLLPVVLRHLDQSSAGHA